MNEIFGSAASLEHFRRFLGAAESHWEVGSEGSDSRVAKYAAVGDYIARKSHVLILLWDGSDNKKVGGTAWVKKRREHWIKAATKDEGEPAAFGYVQTVQIVTRRLAGAGRAQDRPRVKIIEDPPPG